MLENTHHIDGLDDLEGAFLHFIEVQKVIPAERNDAHLLAHGNLVDTLFARGNRLAGEVQRVVIAVDHDLDLVGILEFLDGRHVSHEVDDVDGGILDHGLNGSVDHLGQNHRFVSLNHDNDVHPLSRGSLNLEQGLSGSRGAAGMRVSGHDTLQADAFAVVLNAGVAGGHVGVGKDFAHGCAEGHMSDHGNTVNGSQRFARIAA